MNDCIQNTSIRKCFNILNKAAIVIILAIIISPIIAMISYLLFFDHSSSAHSLENFSELSTLPAYIFSSVICISGMIGFFITISYFILLRKESKLTIDRKVLILSTVFLVWIFLCDLLATDKYSAFFGDSYRQEGFFTIIAYFGICGCAYITFTRINMLKQLLRLFVIVSSIVAFMALLQSFGVYIPFFEYGRPKDQFSGPFMQFNHYGYYLVVGLFSILCLFYLEEKKHIKALILLAFFLQSYVLVLNNTFGCYLATLVGLVFFIIINWIRNGKTNFFDFSFIIILLLSSLIALATPYPSVFTDFVKLFNDVSDIANGEEANGAGTHRWFLWKTSFKEIIKHPIFGIGSDNGTYEMFDNINDRPHNEFIQYALFYGIPGFVMYFSLLLMILFPCLKNIKRASQHEYSCFLISIAYLLSSLFGNTMYYTLPLLLIFLSGTLSIRANFLKASNNNLSEENRDDNQNTLDNNCVTPE